MERSILLGVNNDFSVSWNKRLFLITGISNTLVGVSFGIKEGGLFWLIFGIIMICSGLSQCIFGVLAFSKKSKYAPRVSVNEHLIHIKEKLLRATIEIPWQQIKSIQMASNLIVFSMPDSEFQFNYHANADTSIQIKSVIREVAEKKQIEVLGG